MTGEPPLRAQPDSRILEQDSQQGYLFEEPLEEKEDQLLADYRQRYGLSEDPFGHDYSFPLFTGAGRRQLLDQLLHLCQFSNSLLVVLGDNGVGKTRIAHGFMDSLSDQDQICFLTLRSGQTLDQILLSITQAFGIRVTGVSSVESLLAALEAFIAEEAVSEDDGLAVVVLDNAHLLDDQSISVLTSLLNNFPQQNRLHFALFGEPGLLRRLERLSPENLLCNDFTLLPFNLPETVDYLNFRMEMADYLGPEIFTEAKVDPWWRQAHGQLNVLHGLAEEHLLESVTPVRAVSKRPLPVIHIVAISLLIAVVGVAFLYMGDDEKSPAVASSSSAAIASPSATPTASSSSLELTSTQTPVQPLMQSLPQAQMGQQVGVSAGQPVSALPPETPTPQSPSLPSTAMDSRPVETEKVVPLAQLPTSQPKVAVQPNIESQSGAVTAPEMQVSSPASVSLPQETPSAAAKPVERSEPVTKPEPVAKPSQPAQQSMTASAQEQTILSWKPAEYTIQLLGVSSEKAARDYIAAQSNRGDLLMFKSKRQGRDWFVVITGRFANSAQARQAIANLPASQRDAGPWPRDVKTIQAEIRSGR